jgi:hypothetical protein
MQVSHLRPFGCKCFVLKHVNLDKFVSRSSDGILLGYTPYDRSYRVFNLETNIIVELCDVNFDETAPCPCDVFECVGDKEMEESIFVHGASFPGLGSAEEYMERHFPVVAATGHPHLSFPV